MYEILVNLLSYYAGSIKEMACSKEGDHTLITLRKYI